MEAYASGMAITVRNKALEAKIKDIGRRTGLGPSAVIARAIEGEDARTARQGGDEVAERLARMKRLLSELPTPTEEERRSVQHAMDDMYDEDGLPR